MLSRQEWNENKASDSIVYCFADGTKAVITPENYLRAYPQYHVENFQVIKELSDELLYRDYRADRQSGYWKAKREFTELGELIMSSEPEPLEILLRKEHQRLAFRVAADILRSDQFTEVQRGCFIAYFLQGKSIAQIAREERTYRTTIWRCVRKLEAALRAAAC